MNRRTFVSSLAAAGLTAALSPSAAFARSQARARPRLALIGCGWYGGVVLESFAESTDIEIVSLCDPDARALATTSKKVEGYGQKAPRTFADYRELLKSGPHDIVIVSTPDHWHALPALAALQAGADVFLEKPISVDVIEGEALVAAARKYQRVVQINTQRRSTRCLAEARDKYLRSGRLGTVALAETFSYLQGRPRGTLPVTTPPKELDWELWTGPAPLRPYRLHQDPKLWRAFMEYGNGQMGDLGVHMLDTVRWLLDLGWPSSIVSSGGIYVDRESSSNISDTQRSLFRYPNLDVSWEHRTWGAAPFPARHWTDHWGARLIGSKGTLSLTIVGYEFTPADGGPKEGFNLLSSSGDLENFEEARFSPALKNIQNDHVADFMTARETRSRPISDVEQGHISTACSVLANLSQELGRPLAYDPATRTVPHDEEATRRLSRPYREGWRHPDPADV